MTTDNRTSEPTPEQILVDEWIRQADRAKSMTGMDAIWFPDAEETLAVLRANGLLSEGTPSEAQIERALDGAPEPEWEYGVWNERWAMYPHQERPYPSLAEAQHEASRYPSRRHVVRRRKAGPWEPVGGNDAEG